jgi:F-type H+-transporting ATPase subunit gamma
MLGNLSTSVNSEEGIYFEEREVKNLLVIAVSSNRGLCGGFNSNVVKETNKVIAKNKGAKITVLTVGKKADDYFRKTDFNIKGTTMPRHLEKLWDDLTFENVSPVADKIMNSFLHRQFDQIIFVYNKFKNAAQQIITAEQYVPFMPPEVEEESTMATDFIFEPGKQELFDTLIPKLIKLQFYKVLLDSFAAEHGARMTAMDKATENAEELLGDLRLHYNRARQAAITTELTEIVSGANALEG